MHELSLAQDILDLVQEAAQREPFTRVHRLHLSAPALCGVDAQALRFALEAVAPSTLLAGAEVWIDESAVPACCDHCGAEQAITEHAALCAQCRVGVLRALRAEGLRLVDLEVV